MCFKLSSSKIQYKKKMENLPQFAGNVNQEYYISQSIKQVKNQCVYIVKYENNSQKMFFSGKSNQKPTDHKIQPNIVL